MLRSNMRQGSERNLLFKENIGPSTASQVVVWISEKILSTKELVQVNTRIQVGTLVRLCLENRVKSRAPVISRTYHFGTIDTRFSRVNGAWCLAHQHTDTHKAGGGAHPACRDGPADRPTGRPPRRRDAFSCCKFAAAVAAASRLILLILLLLLLRAGNFFSFFSSLNPPADG